jgi:phosphoribosylaminoimidazole-succinocarboxamide synthase
MQIATESSIQLPGIKKIRGGEVREIFYLEDTLFFVANDRIPAFDVILPWAKR